MTEYDKNKIRRLDLSVLLIFLALMRTRKAADVAAELGLTNSSISHAIRRLRDIFEDELFLRRPHGLEPTAFAERIEPDVRDAVDAVQRALSGPAEFDPTRARGLVHISANDREVAGLIPEAFARVTAEAPGLRFSVRSMSNPDSLRSLADGSLDLAVGFFRDPGPDVEKVHLRTETYSLVARKGHPIFQAEVDVRAYTSASHILVSSDGTLTGIVDQVLADRNMSRRVCLAIPSFMPALAILSNSDFVATLPASLVRIHAAQFGLAYRPPPLEIRTFDVSVLRHRRNLRDPMLSWCLDKFVPA
ncbi:LysR family transcriptional regulator [Rhodobacteraceae bacterium CCMM004]|nr:LysR family transcriptional regulator [Rhodobacteraceae bacterium CCMM004]